MPKEKQPKRLQKAITKFRERNAELRKANEKIKWMLNNFGESVSVNVPRIGERMAFGTRRKSVGVVVSFDDETVCLALESQPGEAQFLEQIARGSTLVWVGRQEATPIISRKKKGK